MAIGSSGTARSGVLPAPPNPPPSRRAARAVDKPRGDEPFLHREPPPPAAAAAAAADDDDDDQHSGSRAKWSATCAAGGRRRRRGGHVAHLVVALVAVGGGVGVRAGLELQVLRVEPRRPRARRALAAGRGIGHARRTRPCRTHASSPRTPCDASRAS